MEDHNKSIKELSRDLRKRSTPSEKIIWELLRNRKFMGFKFLRQYPIMYGNYDTHKLFFIADFYCAEKKLVVELDGVVHDFQKDYDENRDEIIAEKGLTVIRFKNEEVKNKQEFLKKLEAVLVSS